MRSIGTCYDEEGVDVYASNNLNLVASIAYNVYNIITLRECKPDISQF